MANPDVRSRNPSMTGIEPYGGLGSNPYANMPTAPAYVPGYNPSMAMTPELLARINGLRMDTRGLDAFRGLALRSGPSSAAGLMTRRAFADEQNARERAKLEARGAAGEARSMLAMRGGLSSGARERVERGGMRDMLLMSQDVGRQGNLNRMQIGINDEQQRISQLSMLPQLEKQAYDAALQKENLWATARTNDVNRMIAENLQRNSYNQNLYQQQMQAWAANRQAQATENSGK